MKIPEFNLSDNDLINIIDRWLIGRNAERNRIILKRKLIDGITYERLAEECKPQLSVRQVKNIVYKSMQTIIKHI